MTTPPDKLRGGQPGNSNALKHGLYSRHFTPGDLADLPAPEAFTLDAEINLIRLTIQSIAADFATSKPTLTQKLEFLRVFNHAAYNLTRLLKAYNNAVVHQKIVLERQAAASPYTSPVPPTIPYEDPDDLLKSANATLASVESILRALEAEHPGLDLTGSN